MFELEEYIVYGANGVCRVTEICPSPFDASDTRMFYVLKPAGDRGNSVIYTPVDNESVLMRPLLSREAVEGLVARVSSLPVLDVPVERQRKDVYKSTMASVDPELYFRLLKTVYERREAAKEKRKRLPEMDNEYEFLAKKSLYTELSLVLGIPEVEVEGYLEERIG